MTAPVPRLCNEIEALAALYERRFTRTTLARSLAVMEITFAHSRSMDEAEQKEYLANVLAQMVATDKAVRRSGRVKALLKRVDDLASGKRPRRRRRHK